MVLECEGSTDVEIIVGTYEEFVLGYKALKTEDGLSLAQSFATHSHRASVRCVSSGGRFMASGGADDLIQLYDMKLRKEMGVLMHHDKTITCLEFIGQSHLASGSDDGELVLWRCGSWQCEKTFSAHPEGGVCAIAVHPSGKLCLTAGRDRKLRTWSLVKGRPVYTINLHGIAEELQWSSNGDYYAVLKLVKGGADFSVDVYETAKAAVSYSIVPEQRPSSICFTEDDVIAVGTITGSIELHSLATKSLACTFQAHEGRVRCMSAIKFSSGGMWLVSASNNGDITVWKYKESNADNALESPKQLGAIKAGCRVTCLALVITPTGSVPCKTEKTLQEETIEMPEAEVGGPSKPRGRVIVEIEESSEDEEQSQVKSRLTESKKKGKKKKKSEIKKSKECMGITKTKKVKKISAKKNKKKLN